MNAVGSPRETFKDTVVFDDLPYTTWVNKVLCKMLLNITPKSCVRFQESIGREKLSE